jgi:hypothetical protein
MSQLVAMYCIFTDICAYTVLYIGIGPLAGDPTHHIEARRMSQLVAIYCIFTDIQYLLILYCVYLYRPQGSNLYTYTYTYTVL